jgi:hypothetical protein
VQAGSARQTQPTGPVLRLAENQPCRLGPVVRTGLCWLGLQSCVTFHYKRRRPAAGRPPPRARPTVRPSSLRSYWSGAMSGYAAVTSKPKREMFAEIKHFREKVEAGDPPIGEAE